jgi:hypothetical protein
VRSYTRLLLTRAYEKIINSVLRLCDSGLCATRIPQRLVDDINVLTTTTTSNMGIKELVHRANVAVASSTVGRYFRLEGSGHVSFDAPKKMASPMACEVSQG